MVFVRSLIDDDETDLHNIDEKAIVKKSFEVKLFPLQIIFKNSKFSFLSKLLAGTDSYLDQSIWESMEQEKKTTTLEDVNFFSSIVLVSIKTELQLAH